MSRLLLVVGGCRHGCERGALCSIESVALEELEGEIKVSQKLWGRLAVPRRSPAVFAGSSTADEMLFFGGCEEPGKHLNSLETCAGGASTSSTDFSEVEGVSCAAYCCFNEEEALILGGFSGRECLKQVLLFNKRQKRVTKLPDFCSRLKNAAAVALSDGSALVIGGWDERETSKVVFRLKLDESRLDYATNMEFILPYPIEGHAAVRSGNIVYIVGGYDGVSVRRSIIRLDVASGEKEVLSMGLLTARENHVCALLRGEYLLVAGGWDGIKALDSLEIFKILPVAPFLTRLEGEDHRMLQPRNRPGAVVL